MGEKYPKLTSLRDAAVVLGDWGGATLAGKESTFKKLTWSIAVTRGRKSRAWISAIGS